MQTKEERKKYQQRYRKNHIKQHIEYMKKWYKEHKEEAKEYKKRWLKIEKNKIKHRESNKKYNLTHKKEKAIYDKIYRKKNKRKILLQKRKYRTNRLKYDLNFKICHYLRCRINKALKRNSKKTSTLKLLGCSVEQLKRHLEKQFKQGMTWNNWRKWEVDHIKPCCSFDLSKKSEQKKCFNYKNLQPLWKTENRFKSSKIL